jgi:hypothetical protein
MRSRFCAAISSPLSPIAGDGERELRDAIEVRRLGFLEEPPRIPIERRAHVHAGTLGELGSEAADARAAGGERALEFLQGGAERRDDSGSGNRDAP